jgi:hypothetical protein
MPYNANYVVNARTSFGHISTELPITTNHAGENMLTGQIGYGGCKLDLKTSNAGITIVVE